MSLTNELVFQRELLAICESFVFNRSLSDVYQAVGNGLSSLGFQVAVLGADSNGWAFSQFFSPAYLPWFKPGLVDRPPPPWRWSYMEEFTLLLDIPSFLTSNVGFVQEPVHLGVFKLGFVATLRSRGLINAYLVVGSEGRAIEFESAFSLFLRHLNLALAAICNEERVARFESELLLMRELALFSPGVPWEKMCKRVLEEVCALTESHAGSLHRYHRTRDCFSLLPEPLGNTAQFLQHWSEVESPRNELLKVRASGPVDERLVGNTSFLQRATIPLSIDGALVGVINLARENDKPFVEEDLQIAEVLGAQVASLIDRSRLQQETLGLYEEVSASYVELLHSQAESLKNERLAAVGEFAAVMAHEVRNPLAVIYNSMNAMQSYASTEHQVLLAAVREEADRLNRIVTDLLDFVRPFEAIVEEFDVQHSIQNAIKASIVGFEKNWSITTEPNELAGTFLGDAHLVKLALVNLIVNALQSMPKGGVVTVGAKIQTVDQQRTVLFSVSDQGSGISAQSMTKMFQPFFTTKAKGIGLGLAIVRRIAEVHKGSIFVEQNQPKGTTFVLKLNEIRPKQS
jgi:signal transduction histidine kinase